MSREDIQQLLKQIKGLYPRFEGVGTILEDGRAPIPPTVTDAWYSAIGFMELKEAQKILTDYMKSEAGTRTPSAAVWLQYGSRKSNQPKGFSSGAYLDRFNSTMVRWINGEKYESPATFNEFSGVWEDEDGYSWALPEGEDAEIKRREDARK